MESAHGTLYLMFFLPVDFTKITLFKSYAIINFLSSINTAIYMYDVLPVFYSYPNNDVGFDRAVPATFVVKAVVSQEDFYKYTCN